MNSKILIFITIAGLFFSFGCVKKVGTKTDTNTTTTTSNNNPVNNNPNPTPTYGPTPGGGGSVDPSCYAAGVGTQNIEYYTLPAVLGHGVTCATSCTKSGSTYTPSGCTPGCTATDSAYTLNGPGILWSSKTDPQIDDSYNQQIFLTDSRFNVRVLAKQSPGGGPYNNVFDNYGKKCAYDYLAYTKLRVTVKVTTQGGSPFSQTHVFDNIPVGQCSGVHSYTIPTSSQPLVIQVTKVEFDYACTQSGGSNPAFCPFYPVYPHDCWELELQLSTDSTKDIPH